jgi:hypothetical protein
MNIILICHCHSQVLELSNDNECAESKLQHILFISLHIREHYARISIKSSFKHLCLPLTILPIAHRFTIHCHDQPLDFIHFICLFMTWNSFRCLKAVRKYSKMYATMISAEALTTILSPLRWFCWKVCRKAFCSSVSLSSTNLWPILWGYDFFLSEM